MARRGGRNRAGRGPAGRRSGSNTGNSRPLSPGGGGTTGNTGGTSHKASSVEGTPMIKLVYSIAAGVVGTIVFVGYGLLHGYGVV